MGCVHGVGCAWCGVCMLDRMKHGEIFCYSFPVAEEVMQVMSEISKILAS